MAGHTIARCYKIHGHPSKNSKHNNNKKIANAAQIQESEALNNSNSPFTDEQYSYLMTLINKEKEQDHITNDSLDDSTNSALLAGKYCFLFKNLTDWVIDIGATDHICHGIKQFTRINSLHPNIYHITIPNGKRIVVHSIGEVQLTKDILLKNVLYIPSFHFNLIYVPQLVKDLQCSIFFNASGCFCQGPSMRRPWCLGELTKGLYHSSRQSGANRTDMLPPASSSLQANSLTLDSPNLDAIKLWHLRLGHIPVNILKYVDTSLCSKSFNNACICSICPLAKQCRSPFGHSEIKTSRIFELVHVDVWGPYHTPTTGNCSGFLTIVDDYSRSTWVYLLRKKNESVNLLQHFFTYIEKQFGTFVKVVRSDNAKELCEGDTLKLYQTKGIIHQKSTAATPQQNGVVERKHRHLLEVARALLFQSNLPTKFWGDCIQTVVYIINRSPLPSIGYTSPYERLFGNKPSYDHMRAFGCLCFVNTLKQGRTKFEARAHPCVFLGYPFGQKAYKIYDLTTKRVIVTRDIKFFERHFPFHFSSKGLSHTTAHFFLPISTIVSTPSSTFFDEFSTSYDTSQTIDPSTNESEHFFEHEPDTTEDNNASNQAVRRSTRLHNPPSHLKDYISTDSINAHWCNLVNTDSFSDLHNNFDTQDHRLVEPTSYKQAIKDPLWVQAMKSELQALQQNETWKLVSLPYGKKPIGCKWVYKLKYKADGSLERHKARLVAKGYTQEYGVDYEETFSPVIKMNFV